MTGVQKVSACIWFDRDGEAAAKFYTSLIANSEITNVSRYGEGAPMPAGTAMLVNFTLGGAAFSALNGGPMFKPSEAWSFVVQCEDQAEVDRLWAALTADGGEESMCGWLRDRWGVSWQIVPRALPAILGGPDPAGVQRAMGAMMTMKKLDIARLEAAYRGG